MQEKLNAYLKDWQLEQPELIAETNTSHVYRVNRGDEILALKLLNPIGMADEWGGALALDYYAEQGAVKIFEHDEGAHLLEYLDGDDLIPLVDAGEDDKATAISTEVLNKLHQSQGEIPAIRHLKSWFQALFDKAKADEIAGIDSIFRRAAPLARDLLDNPRGQVVLHADIHHANIRYSQRGYLAFDPKGIYGERSYDAANMLYNPRPEIAVDETRLFRAAGILAKALNLDYQRYLKFAYAYGCLSAAWTLESEDGDASSTLSIATMLEEAIN